MARLSEGSLTKEKMTQKLLQLLLPQVLAAARPKMPVVWGGQRGTVCGVWDPHADPGAMGVCKHVLGSQCRFLIHSSWAAAGRARPIDAHGAFQRGERIWDLVCSGQLHAS